MTHQTTTQAEWASYGWELGLTCGKCRKPIAALDGAAIMARFGGSLLATLGEVCERIRCPTCGQAGGWASGVAGISPESVVTRHGEILSTWHGRDLYLRKMLAEHGRPLEIADVVWAKVEAREADHCQWQARMPEREGCPLSEAGAVALSVTVKNGSGI